jgi:hypothetical protein
VYLLLLLLLLWELACQNPCNHSPQEERHKTGDSGWWGWSANTYHCQLGNCMQADELPT